MYTLVSHYQRPVLDEISGDGGPIFSLQERGAVAGSEEVKERARVPCHTSESHPLLVIYAEAEGAGVTVQLLPDILKSQCPSIFTR